MKLFGKDGRPLVTNRLADKGKLAVYPGSFNPLHQGHQRIYDLLTGKGYHVVFEMSQTRYQKEPYSDEKFGRLVAQFRGYAPVLVSDAPLFMDKRESLKDLNPYWVMGYDTAKRWIDENQHVDAEEKGKIDKMKVVFIGRLSDGVYYDPTDLLNGSEKYECIIVHFRCDISSTQIRQQRSAK